MEASNSKDLIALLMDCPYLAIGGEQTQAEAQQLAVDWLAEHGVGIVRKVCKHCGGELIPTCVECETLDDG
jgi:hypothetical protein